MATYSNNTTIKFVGSATFSASLPNYSGGTSVNSTYTVPSGHFAIISREFTSASLDTSVSTYRTSGGVNGSGNVVNGYINQDVHVPEGTLLTISLSRKTSSGLGGNGEMIICLFKNTP